MQLLKPNCRIYVRLLLLSRLPAYKPFILSPQLPHFSVVVFFQCACPPSYSCFYGCLHPCTSRFLKSCFMSLFLSIYTLLFLEHGKTFQPFTSLCPSLLPSRASYIIQTFSSKELRQCVQMLASCQIWKPFEPFSKTSERRHRIIDVCLHSIWLLT